jgi:hypothetical protein
VESSTTINGPFSIDEILRTDSGNFLERAISQFRFQHQHNRLYQQWVTATHRQTEAISALSQIPFLPISFFKTHTVQVGMATPQLVFTSSGTTGMATSRHPVLNASWYERSFSSAFNYFYGTPQDWAIIGLLPSYLERQGSSLVYMVEHLIEKSNNEDSGLYLYDFQTLTSILQKREQAGKRTWLIGVTYALLDFAEQYPQPLQYTTVLETGGMKGRKREITRMEVQQMLQQAFQLTTIHSEYGMTELLSQAYSAGGGLFRCPPWMQVLVRDEDDPFRLQPSGTGALCIVDLANAYSCSFIATEDIGKVHADGRFEVLGRLDNSDVRGCSLLAL